MPESSETSADRPNVCRSFDEHNWLHSFGQTKDGEPMSRCARCGIEVVSDRLLVLQARNDTTWATRITNAVELQALCAAAPVVEARGTWEERDAILNRIEALAERMVRP
jgi:hypothetical protein